MTTITDERVKAIREDDLVGEGSCSVIDECWSDTELIETLNAQKISTPEAAVQWAISQEGGHLEQGLNQRWGEDEDPQLKAYQEFKAKVDTRN